ncbi:hypothetical protein V2J09_010229 [Rumex salicifolius]
MASTGCGNSAKRSTSHNVAAGSVWESRMRIDQVRGGVKVFSGGVENLDVDDKSENRGSEQTSRSSPGIGLVGKKRASKSESNPIQIVASRSPSQIQRKTTWNGNCKSPVQLPRKKLASDDDEDDKRSPILIPKSRSDLKLSGDSVAANGLDCSIRVEDDRNLAEDKNCGELTVEKIEKGPDSDYENNDECVRRSGNDDINGYARGEDEVEEAEVEDKIDEKNNSINEEIVVEKNISTCDYKQLNITETSHSNSKSKLKQKLPEPTIASVRSSRRTEFSPVRKPPQKFARPQSFPIKDSVGTQRDPKTNMMWKHVPRSSLAFGSGTFLIISSSCTRDLDISFISITSYLGLIYLAITFLYKSFKCRQIMEGNGMDYSHGMVVIGEQEAIWVLRLMLPYVNDFLLTLKALFSGDPAVTMKLAAALFALARCGNSITIWKMIKLAFILPKLSSSYSAQITGHGKHSMFSTLLIQKVLHSHRNKTIGRFWFLRFHDAWRSCSHKKTVGFAIFVIVWNLSSIVARIWAAFMLFVAVRYYQQSWTIKTESCDEDEDEVEKGRTVNYSSKPRQGRRSTTPLSVTDTRDVGIFGK